MIVILPASNPAKITTLKDLAKNGVKISMEIPHVPAGMATLKVLAHMAGWPAYGTSYQRAVKQNIVSQEETVKGVVQAEFHPDGPACSGPPREARLSPGQITQWCQQAGLQVVHYARQTDEHYMLTVQRSNS